MNDQVSTAVCKKTKGDCWIGISLCGGFSHLKSLQLVVLTRPLLVNAWESRVSIVQHILHTASH